MEAGDLSFIQPINIWRIERNTQHNLLTLIDDLAFTQKAIGGKSDRKRRYGKCIFVSIERYTFFFQYLYSSFTFPSSAISPLINKALKWRETSKTRQSYSNFSGRSNFTSSDFTSQFCSELVFHKMCELSLYIWAKQNCNCAKQLHITKVNPCMNLKNELSKLF